MRTLKKSEIDLSTEPFIRIAFKFYNEAFTPEGETRLPNTLSITKVNLLSPETIQIVYDAEPCDK